MKPPLTVVCQPVAELGRAAAERLLGRASAATTHRRAGAAADPADRARLLRSARVSDVAELLAELVAADSTNPTLVPGGVGEAEVGAHPGRAAGAGGLEVDVWDAAPGRPNVVGRLRGTGGGRSLMFCGHTDVVGADPERVRAGAFATAACTAAAPTT